MDRRQKTKPLGVARYTTPPPGPFTPRPLIASTQAARKHDMSVPTMPTSKKSVCTLPCMHACRVAGDQKRLLPLHPSRAFSLTLVFLFLSLINDIFSLLRACRTYDTSGCVCEWVVDNGAGMLTQRGRGRGNAGCLMIFLHGID